MQKLPESEVLRDAHMRAMYLPAGVAHCWLTHANICGPHLLCSQSVPSQVKVSPSGLMCCGAMHAAPQAIGWHCVHVVWHARVTASGAPPAAGRIDTQTLEQ